MQYNNIRLEPTNSLTSVGWVGIGLEPTNGLTSVGLGVGRDQISTYQ